jgi:hypothetical protein
MRRSIRFAAWPALLLAVMIAPAEAPAAGSARALADLEGTVVALGTGTAEGELPVVTVALQTETGEREVALAPESVLAEAGFVVEEGDRLRARVFVDPAQGPAAAQKVMNLSRDLLLRLRTFSRAPIWDAQGQWEGARTDASEAGRRQRRPTRRPQPPPPRLPPPPPTRPPPTH